MEKPTTLPSASQSQPRTSLFMASARLSGVIP